MKMKYINPICLLILVGILAIFTNSCKKDKDNETPSNENYFKVDTLEFELSSGVLENFGPDLDAEDDWYYNGYNFDLSLVSKGIGISVDEDGYVYATGEGQALYFEMYSSGAALDTGEYNFSLTTPSPVKTFDYGDYSITWDEVNDDGWLEIISGKVQVNKIGNLYEITINCQDENGKIITGYYKGTLKYFDYTSDLKSKRIKPKKRR